MKRILVYVFVVITFCGCGKEEAFIRPPESSGSISRPQKRVLEFKDDYVTLEAGSGLLRAEINSNVKYSFRITESWIHERESSFSNGHSGKTLNLQVGANRHDRSRDAEIIIYNNQYELSDTLHVIQYGDNSVHGTVADGDVSVLQKASRGKANLVIMGDGFVKEHLHDYGFYFRTMNQAMEYFFSIEPYDTYRDYFNVYTVAVESETDGIPDGNSLWGNKSNSRFEISFGEGTAISCNDEIVFEYVRRISELPENQPVTVIVVLNCDKYAGTAYMYSDGSSIALCPMSTADVPDDFEGIIHHEAGGHGFGLLCDEYVYHQKTIPDSRREEIRDWQESGFYLNLDFTDDFSRILWKDFIGMDKYSEVGAYEGGYEYQFGVWRSEENSCMNNNIPYYNVQSRWAIVDRIMKLSDIEYSINDFIAADNPEPYVVTKSQQAGEFVPLGDPVLIHK